MEARLSEAIDQFCADGPAGILVALDFDGTLAPLVDDPTHATPVPEAALAMGRLALAGVDLALVSGRNLTDLAERAAPPEGTYLVGSHGAERGVVDSTGLRTGGLVLTDEQASTLTSLVEALGPVVEGRPGTWVQVKPSAAVVHTREATPADALAATTGATAIAVRFGRPAMIGKNVIEIAILDTSKGRALDALRHELGSTGASRRLLFAGDDTTDESGFGVLLPGDVGIKVGDGPTAATHRVADPDRLAEVLGLLTRRLAS